MNHFLAALWTETLKARRSKVRLFVSIGFTLAPLRGGLFRIIMKDPEAAREMGLLSPKAQLMMGTADWPTYFGLLSQSVAVAGAILFSIVTTWIFGREFSDRTAKELMSLPTSRESIVAAKLIVMGVWALAVTIAIFILGLIVGALVDVPGWDGVLAFRTFKDVILIAAMTILLMSPVAFIAGLGRGYLPPMGWTILTIFL